MTTEEETTIETTETIEIEETEEEALSLEPENTAKNYMITMVCCHNTINTLEPFLIPPTCAFSVTGVNAVLPNPLVLEHIPQNLLSIMNSSVTKHTPQNLSPIINSSVIETGEGPFYEDFTTYTEVDPNNHISKTGTRVDSALWRNEDAYVYKDKGIDYFGTVWEHKLEITPVSRSGNGGINNPWTLSNAINDFWGLQASNEPVLALEYYYYGAYLLYLLELKSGTQYASSSYTLTQGTTYYLTINRNDSSLSCKIYSDSARTNLLATLSLTLHTQPNHRYIFGCMSANDGAGVMVQNYTDYLDLGT